jgi:glycerol-3-phosphate dehydrogenase
VDERAVDSRVDALERLGSRRFDLLVIGGGIVGAGIAEAASAHGLAVALVDRGDFGGATSSASSKLVHGGLRYLRLGDVGLVREAHHERRLLMRCVAPHLVRRLPFLFPLYGDGPFRPWFVQSGIVVYSTLARAKLNGLVGVDRARKLVPPLRDAGLRSCALYEDAWTNDGRLTLANVRAAADRGAVVANYAEVVGLGAGTAEVAVEGRTIQVHAAAIANAAGPWVDRVRRLEDPRAGRSVRLSKGVHVVVEGGGDWSAALTVPQDKVRVSFAVPWEGMLLLGTTDSEHDGEPETVSVDDADVEQVLAEASLAVDGLGPPQATFAGLRVLPGGDGETESAKRETVFSTGPSGMVSVAGGKLTTYRRIALDALDHLGVRGLSRRPRALPGAPASTGSPGPWSSTPRRERTCSTSTARSRSRSSPRPRTTRRCSSRSSPPGPTSVPRSSTPAPASGRVRTRTSSAAGRPPGSPRPDRACNHVAKAAWLKRI